MNSLYEYYEKCNPTLKKLDRAREKTPFWYSTNAPLWLRVVILLIAIVILCLTAGMQFTDIIGVVGIGTIITAFFMGPLITFFNTHVAQPILNGRKKTT